jgi:hypothetical protein
MATNNKLNVSLSGQTGTGNFVGATSPTLVTPVLGAATATQLTATNIIGTTTNNSAAAGSVGEFMSANLASGSAISTTNGAYKDLVSLDLTAGDWDVWGTVCSLPDGSGVTTRVAGWVHTVSATPPTAPAGGTFVYMFIGLTAAGSVSYFPIGRKRFSVASTTTVYLTGGINFSAGTMSIYGYIAARRVR